MARVFTDHAAWQEANGEFLAASLQWLRELLTECIADRGVTGADDSRSPAAVGAGDESGTPDRGAALAVALGIGNSRPVATTEPGAEPAAPEPAPATAAALRRLAQAEDISPPPALAGLATTFGLSRFERDTLLLCAALELDPSIATLYAQAQGNSAMGCATFALALGVLPDPTWAMISPQQGLRYWRLIEINQPAGQTLTAAAIRTDERIVNLLKGLNYLDDRLDPLTTRLEADLEVDLPASQQAVVDRITTLWRTASDGGPVIQLAGSDALGKQLITAHAAARGGLLTYRMPAAVLPTQATELDNLARLWQRESMLLPVALYLDVGDTTSVDAPPIGRFLERLHCPIFLAVRESWPDLGAASCVLDTAPPNAQERAVAWRDTLPAGTDQTFVDSVAAQFAVDVPTIHHIAAAGGSTQQLWDACRSRTRPRLDSLARRVEPRVDWNDLVLPAEQTAMLHQIADQVAHRTTVYDGWGFGDRSNRGLGVSALFAGPSGVGKTMGAEVLAAHLDLDLYRIDLSAVVSKYIGETEKNLRRLFDAAEGGGVILFFDEADALFGKRSEIKDAHDRYANTQTNDLLQRMEEYSGLAILATNMRRALDGAFMRRLRFIVEFPFPEAAERKALWQKAFPAHAPTAELDFDRLAKLRLTGGMARNIALNAAFIASAAGESITMPAVLRAARSEFRKLELPIREQEFAWAENHPL